MRKLETSLHRLCGVRGRDEPCLSRCRIHGAAHAEQRTVSVNGAWLGPAELVLADRNAGYRVPNGCYRYDMSSGYWGLVGGPVLGRVPPAQGSGGERGWCHAGPGGYGGSDGSCFYFLDPQTGASVMSGNC